MDFATEVATSQVVWAILCIILAFAVIREMRKENIKREHDLIGLYEKYRQESKRREERLMTHLERSNESQEQTTQSLKRIQQNLIQMESRLDRMEKKIYR